ncbi:MAG: hypothetical protein NC218_01845 [Acetobacter sp.]|nr:hypothetical protein [Acetobacter sp.]
MVDDKTFFTKCPECGSTDIRCTNPDDGVGICADCRFHYCIFQKNVKCHNKDVCTPLCMRHWLSKREFHKVVKEYGIPKNAYHGEDM